MDQNHVLLQGLTDDVFIEAALAVIGFLLTALLSIGVYYLSRITETVGKLGSSVDIMLERSTNHGQRLDRLEGAVFHADRSVS